MKHRRKHKCKNCSQLYKPDYRTGMRQRYCSATACRAKSKQVSHQRWLCKPANWNYFRGSENVQRVQQWRQAHPGYWRRGKGKHSALQDQIHSQPLGGQWGSWKIALQDECLLQPSLLVGLISNLTGSALQEDIAQTLRQMQTRGQMILGMAPGIGPKGEGQNARETRVVPRTVKLKFHHIFAIYFCINCFPSAG